MVNDLILTLQWWITLLLIGIAFLPMSAVLLSKFEDLGYAFSKIIGTVIISYLIYLLTFFHIIPFSTLGAGLVLWLLFLVNVVIVKKMNLWKSLKSKIKLFIFEEIIVLAALIFWAFIRGFQPDINGLEKFMDFGFVNSILRSTYMPPTDIWYTPEPINYYYFGHFITALLTKLSLLPSYITYNLMIATIFALCLAQSFSIGLTFGRSKSRLKKYLMGFMSGILVTFGGNLHTLYSFFKPYQNEYPKPLWELPLSLGKPGLGGGFPNSYWYPNATRFISNTIHEFPIYSFVVSDLHGHVLGIPIVLFLIAFFYQQFLTSHFSYKSVAITAFFLGVCYMTNAWDFLIYGLLGCIVIASIESRGIEINFSTKKPRLPFRSFSILGTFPFARRMIFKLVLLGIVAYVILFPFNSAFSPFASQIGILCAPEFLTEIESIGPFLFEKDHCQHSPWWQLIILYGFFYFFVFSFFVFFLARKKYIPSKTDVYITILILVSTILLVAPEFIYAKDIYPAHYRANTMFKLAYQAFIMLSLASAYIIVHISKETKNKIFAGISVALISLVLFYPFFAVSSYYGELKSYKKIDGISYLSLTRPADYSAINWINKYIKGQPVILEAQGDSYTDYARISANTGLPTILGWTVHEWLWRGSYEITVPRIEDVKTLYESEDVEKTKSLIKKYNISYIYIGNLEYEKYPNLNLQKFEDLGTVVFEEGVTKLIELNTSKVF